MRTPLSPLEIEVDAETPFSVLDRIVDAYGLIGICQDKVVVLPVDAEAARWITSTLTKLGYTQPGRNST